MPRPISLARRALAPASAVPGALLAALALWTTACEPASDATPDGPESPDAALVEPAPPPPPPAPSVTAGELTISDLVVTEPVTGDRAALYLTVRSTVTDTLLAVAAEGAATGSLHRTTTEDGVTRMRPVEGGVPIPVAGEARLRPGGLHGMLEGLDAPWAPGDTIPLTLTFRVAGPVEAPALVVPYAELDARFPTGATESEGAHGPDGGG